MSAAATPGATTGSGVATVQSVTGPVPVDALGITLPHEHLLNDVTSWSHRTSSLGWDPDDFAARPVTTDLLWDLRHDPFGNLDNCRLDDVDVAVSEVDRYAALGGRTIVDATGLGIGRDLDRLAQISERTGVTIIAGTGFYLDGAQPEHVKSLHPEAIAELIVDDVRTGENGIRPGIIGEIGVGADLTGAEERSLRGAFLAQRETGLTVQVHLPAWFRLAGRVLDIADEMGVPARRVVLCHMGPSGDDLDYQESVLARGAFVQYDMLGMEVFYADQGVQCPSDAQNAAWIARLVERGHTGQLLLSQDIFLKSLLRTHGGPGYAHLLQYFVPRLRAAGVPQEAIDRMLVDNPRSILHPEVAFDAASGAPTTPDTPTKEN